MKKKLTQLILLLCFGAMTANAFALSDDFYSSGEDLDYLFDAESTFGLEVLENKLRRFVIYRKLEDLLLNFGDEYPGISQ